MNKLKWIVAAAVAVLLIIAASVMFYRTVFISEQPEDYKNFASNLTIPIGITITDKINKPLIPGSSLREGELEIKDMVVVKTIFIELGKSEFTKADKSDKEDISDAERAFSIGMLYGKEAPKSNRLTTIEVLQDGTFITSKVVNGRQQYVKGKFNNYTMDFLEGLYTLR